ncbi:FecR family protein [Agrobacterium tumefaciens]|uniref:FecR family protein n=1 Tax=Agrobacterium tumefaciens TaxID=358 RepID=UPI0021D0F934|nr:FecR domain-containing protein [Agrobacterium tumefaciens]UXS04237.1 DUF4880 domain-containing protein [Agrobacterium tumefaciens]
MREGTGEQSGSETFLHPDPAVDAALDWLVRLEAAGHVDKTTRSEFDVWLAAAPSHQKAWKEIHGLWAAPETLVAAQELEVHLSQQPVLLDEMREKKRPRWSFRSFAMASAASLVLVAGTAHVISNYLPRMLADYTTSTGERREIALPDGSRMILNTHSAVALDFTEGQRGVRLLQGEAFFDVVHDAEHPFHVAAAYSEVRVKGTAFGVRTEDDTDTVSLQRGAVDAVHERKDIPVAHLSPGEMVVASEKSLSSVASFNSDENFGWLKGRVVIEAQPLSKALEEVGRYFDGRIFILNRALLDVAVSGDYRIDSAEAAIDSLTTAAGGKITVVPGGYIIIR